MTTHRLKVLIKYADAIINGTKTFEVRKNDRGYEVGDKIVFDVVTNKGYAVGEAARHPLNGATYRITDEERREAVEFLRSGKCLYFAEHRKTELDCNRCMKVSTMLFGHYDALCGLDSCGTDTW